jgi:hypothetical protein
MPSSIFIVVCMAVALVAVLAFKKNYKRLEAEHSQATPLLREEVAELVGEGQEDLLT